MALSGVELRNESSTEDSISLGSEKTSETSSEISERLLETQLKEKARSEKAEAIRQACCAHDMKAIVHHAVSEGGLLEDELRRQAWPILLQLDKGIQNDNLKPSDELPPHTDEEQVQLDVNRSFVYYPKNLPAEDMAEKKAQLSTLITQILRNYPMLCYFQGYHDIVQVFSWF